VTDHKSNELVAERRIDFIAHAEHAADEAVENQHVKRSDAEKRSVSKGFERDENIVGQNRARTDLICDSLNFPTISFLPPPQNEFRRDRVVGEIKSL
jgi:hypothetical protein